MDKVLLNTMQALRELNWPEEIIFAGNSDGATWIHYYVSELLEYKIPVKYLVHYGGLEAKSPYNKVVDSVVPFICHGANDRIKRIKRDTAIVANDYNESLYHVHGGHKWDSRNNMIIRKTLGVKE